MLGLPLRDRLQDATSWDTSHWGRVGQMAEIGPLSITCITGLRLGVLRVVAMRYD
jgi:hypothetical protein